MQSMHQSQSQVANAPVTGLTSTTATTNSKGSTPTTQATAGTQQTPTPSNSSTPQPSSTSQSAAPTQAPPPPSPSPSPSPSPPPSHTGTVIGYTNQATNSATSFTNPADGRGCLLIRLPNGNFVAAERVCTHEGVAVNYNSGNQKLVCPAHGAVFDPSNGCSHVSGPGNGPLAAVSIRVNADGTI